MNADQLARWRTSHSIAQACPHPHEGYRARSIRVAPAGEMVAQFFLPLALAKPINRTRGPRKAGLMKAHRDEVLGTLMMQKMLFGVPFGAVAGRALVRCIRYSSSEPDATSAWSKVPVDCLQPGGIRKVSRKVRHPRGHDLTITREVRYDGLGIIRSDRPLDTDVVEWWEPAKPGQGFCVIEVWA